MKILKKATIALLVCVVSFSACKKDKDSLSPKDFANDICACMDKTTSSAKNSCMDNLEVKYAAIGNDKDFAEKTVNEMKIECLIKFLEWDEEFAFLIKEKAASINN